MEKIKINYCAFLNSSGYSQAAQDLILALYKSKKYNISLSTFPGGNRSSSISSNKRKIFSEMEKINKDKDAIQIFHCIPTIQKRISKNKKNIGFATFETFSPPFDWINILNTNDAIISPSEFNYKIFSHERIKKPIFYIPHCLDVDIFNEDVFPMKKFDKFTFLFFGTWKKRKGYEVLIEAWLNEFSSLDNVQLVIKTDRVVEAKKYIEEVKKHFIKDKGFSPIIYESNIIEDYKLPSFLKSFDCLISPGYGEGFGLPGLQCMSLGVPIITTNFAGSKDYANNETATLIEPKGFIFKKDMDGIPQFKDKKWAFVDRKDVQNKMKEVFENYSVAKEKSKLGIELVKTKFNYAKIENMFYQMLGQIYGF